MPTILGLIVVAALGAGAYYWWTTPFTPAADPTPEPIEETPLVQNTTYASSTMKFSLSYPQGFTLREQYAYTRVSPTRPISGVQFTVPPSFTEGTNLASDSSFSVEQLPRANNCTADIFLKADVKAYPTATGAVRYTVATSTETVGADTFDETVFAVASSSPCIAVRYFLHTTSATGTQPYDRAAVLAAFETIRQSLSVQ